MNITLTIETRQTGAAVGIHQILTRAAILAGHRQALVKVMRAMRARVAGAAVALVGTLGVAADAIVADVGADGALVHVLGAVGAGEAGRTGAAVLAHQVATGGAVAAGTGHTLVNVLSAVLTLVATSVVDPKLFTGSDPNFFFLGFVPIYCTN
jgi:hypothetical protein